MTPEAYCRDKARASGSSFFYAFLFLPDDQRRAIMALYAFCREVDDIADEVSDQQVAISKLAFWRNELDSVFSGQPQHPVARELNWARQHYPLDEELLIEILDGMQMDIMHQAIRKPADLSLYAYRVAGTVGLLSIEIFGYSQRRSRDFATSLGEALQLTNILRDLAVDARMGRIYIPQSDRIHYKIGNQEFKDGVMSKGMQQMLTEYGEKAEAAFEKALAYLPEQDRESLRPSLLMGAIYYAYLNRLQQVGFNVWKKPVRILPVRKIWIAWQAWHYERKACKNNAPLRLKF
jgi:phytoene synthase